MGGQAARVIVMEMGPVLTALVIAGRIGASMTAEIGTMKVTEQVDALRTMAIDPIRYIVMPRFLGLSLMMPVLTVFSCMVALLGAFLVSNYFLDITQQVFFGSIRDFFDLWDLMGGLIKALVFGMLISLIALLYGDECQWRRKRGRKGNYFILCSVGNLYPYRRFSNVAHFCFKFF